MATLGRTKSVLERRAGLRPRLSRGQRGASLVEYALVVSFIATASVSGLQFMGDSTNDRFDEVATDLDGDPIAAPRPDGPGPFGPPATTAPPVTFPAVTIPAVTVPPSTAPTPTVPPTTAPPTSAPPTTVPPVTTPPVTRPPDTTTTTAAPTRPPGDVPPTTAPPETAPPETAPPTDTRPPTTKPGETTTTTAPTRGGSDFTASRTVMTSPLTWRGQAVLTLRDATGNPVGAAASEVVIREIRLIRTPEGKEYEEVTDVTYTISGPSLTLDTGNQRTDGVRPVAAVRYELLAVRTLRPGPTPSEWDGRKAAVTLHVPA